MSGWAFFILGKRQDLKRRRPGRSRHDLAGTWDEKRESEFKQAVQIFEELDSFLTKPGVSIIAAGRLLLYLLLGHLCACLSSHTAIRTEVLREG
jgi:hypothetical protein